MSKQRLSKILAAAGIASRRKAEELIFSGRVTVNGSVEKVPQTPCDPLTDKITVDGEDIRGIEEKVYYILNKPKGYVCTALRTGHAKSVLELFDDVGLRLFTVGRLDKDTEGLLIVTNDGHFANNIIHPSKNLVKEYVAKTDSEILHEHLVKITQGTQVEGTFVKPLSVKKVRKGTLKIEIGEGKKREVRLLLENAGLNVKSLTRIRIGSLVLGPLPVGTYRELTEREKHLLLQNEK